jgi:hypothetical protein
MTKAWCKAAPPTEAKLTLHTPESHASLPLCRLSDLNHNEGGMNTNAQS